MKVTVSIVAEVLAMLETRYDVPKLQNAIDSAYNDNTAIIETETGIKSAKANEKKGKEKFDSKDSITQVRAGKLTDPLRFVAWNVNFGKFIKTNGTPSGNLTEHILPANILFWLESKFLKADVSKSDALGAVKVQPHRNGNIESVPAAK